MSTEAKVNWIRKHVTGNGTEIAVSERTGLVKVTVPGMNQRSFMGYADELLQLFGSITEVTRYLEQNVDVAISRDQSKDIRKVKQTQERTKLKAAQALQGLGINVDDLNAFLAAKKQA